MTELIKAGDLSGRYSVSTRTLRYYEEIGLIQSRRIEGYAYRMYDDENIKRLEQIIILRKLGIGIKDIRRVFASSDSGVVLEILGKKVEDIDEEVALLHELKAIVLEFINQIKVADFSDDGDVKQLYEKAKDIETQLTKSEYNGNASPVNRLFEVTEKLEEKAISKLQIPDNVLKRLLKNVYFILGDGLEVADELGSRHNIFVYHTCDYRHIHHQNADPQYQPGMFRSEMDSTNYFLNDPEDVMKWECEIVRDFTPMVIMDLIQLSATHERIICENDIDIDSIFRIMTNVVIITREESLDGFIAQYENGIRSRDISEYEKERLARKVHEVWDKGKPENPRDLNPYGVKQIFLDDYSTVGQTADTVADYFGFSRII